jgi:hypothetical protein
MQMLQVLTCDCDDLKPEFRWVEATKVGSFLPEELRYKIRKSVTVAKTTIKKGVQYCSQQN